ncbi:hypothetical protein [Anaerobaca lacustris]|uniref:DUF4349 domain-containing protein n=1 Tax=Anaerobaca lacustris TaxID=3044600 RepID=A0AAW6TXQ6_9BACT|nr:hypothetical protein [Sedimentisphaerales bacterium M17dextr]
MATNRMAWVRVTLVLLMALLISCAAESGSSQYIAPPMETIDRQDIAVQIGSEKSSYSKSYMVDAIEVVGKCDAVLNSPKYLIFSAASEANTAYSKLRIRYSEFEDSALDGFLAKTVTKVGRLSDNVKYVDEQNAKHRTERDYDGMKHKLDEIGNLMKEIRALIEGINSAI